MKMECFPTVFIFVYEAVESQLRQTTWREHQINICRSDRYFLIFHCFLQADLCNMYKSSIIAHTYTEMDNLEGLGRFEQREDEPP